MGLCHEFGIAVGEGCGHPMTAGQSACHCTVCNVVCEGRFGGCSTVWARGPREVVLVRPNADDALLASKKPPTADRAARRPRPLVSATPPGTASEGSPPPEPPAQPAELVVSREARGQVFEWLQDSFEGLQAELRRLSEAVDRQQRGVGVADAGDAAGRLWDLADTLPRRIDQAVRDALGPQAVAAHPHPDQQEAGHATSSAGRGINRDGWQDKLRALGPAGSQSGG